MKNSYEKDTVTLAEVATQAMIERDFIIDFPPAVEKEIATIITPANIKTSSSFRDLRDRLWISIDNDDSKDLDQLTFAERLPSGTNKIFVAIADVDALVKKGSAIDLAAFHNTTSVYTPEKVFPMLPLKLSTNLTSLNENEDRCAVVVEMEIFGDGEYKLIDIYPSLVRNHAKLAYNNIADWLTGKASLPESVSQIKELPAQIKLQDQIAQKIKEFRFREGALNFSTIELQLYFVNGVPTGLEQIIHNRANSLIENYMIAANVCVTRYMIEHKIPTLRRVVRVPTRWERIVALASDLKEILPPEPDSKALRDFLQKQRQINPLNFPDLSLAIIKLIGRGEYVAGFPGEPAPGHFDLALNEYAHTTAPNRRYPDLIMQRLLKSYFYHEAIPYTNDELVSIAEQCTQKEDDATKVERRVMKSAAALILADLIGHQFPAIVTGANEKGTWVRLLDPPVEGKLVQGFENVDVGDHISVKLIHVDIRKGFIDFARIQ